MKHLNIKSIVFLLIISFSLILAGCSTETNSDATSETSSQETHDDTSTNPSSSETTTQTSTEVISESKDTTNSQNNQGNIQTNTQNTFASNKQLPDVVLSNFKIYDLGQKKDVAIGEPIIASNPIEMTITLKNQGNAPYQDAKGNAPILIFMITPAYTGNLYFYSSNYTPLNAGDERIYKTNPIKFRTTGTHSTKIYPNIQYTNTQPEELNKENNELVIDLIVKTK